VRGAVSYLSGTNQLLDDGQPASTLLISKESGLLKTARLEPFAGWSLISIFRHRWNSRRHTLV